ncbi:hypothetical protein FRC10_002677 [Ceratobasidium sp. 414]|nr:hypothetical protein FRC10_002677 [Ceratobasidium sp. 414]
MLRTRVNSRVPQAVARIMEVRLKRHVWKTPDRILIDQEVKKLAGSGHKSCDKLMEELAKAISYINERILVRKSWGKRAPRHPQVDAGLDLITFQNVGDLQPHGESHLEELRAYIDNINSFSRGCDRATGQIAASREQTISSRDRKPSPTSATGACLQVGGRGKGAPKSNSRIRLVKNRNLVRALALPLKSEDVPPQAQPKAEHVVSSPDPAPGVKQTPRSQPERHDNQAAPAAPQPELKLGEVREPASIEGENEGTMTDVQDPALGEVPREIWSSL